MSEVGETAYVHPGRDWGASTVYRAKSDMSADEPSASVIAKSFEAAAFQKTYLPWLAYVLPAFEKLGREVCA